VLDICGFVVGLPLLRVTMLLLSSQKDLSAYGKQRAVWSKFASFLLGPFVATNLIHG
jgi:hypothetical protein